MEKSLTNVYYKLAGLCRDGGHFVIYKQNHSKKILDKAKKLLNYQHDVVTLMLVDDEPSNWSKRFEVLSVENG